MKEKKVKRFLAITMFVLLAFIFCSGTFVVKSSVAAATLEMNNINDSNLPMYLVEYSLKYDIDLCFMMAQTSIETGFGTAGAGKPTSRHSLFGVCKRYSNYDKAVEDYCKLLRKSYLGKRKTEYDLMKNYVTLGGDRYAANRGYEQKLSKEYKCIRNRTQIYELWKELKNS